MQQFQSVVNLYNEDLLENLRNTHVAIVGIGGVGSWACESLVRSGIGELTLIDMDEICLSNLNRQIHALHSTIGQPKIDIMKNRLLDINPNLKINLKFDYLTEKNSKDLLTNQDIDFVIDAIDSPRNKALIITTCLKEKTPFITIGASGRKLDPSLIQYGKIQHSIQDNLLAQTRKILKKEKGLNLQSNKIQCLFSPEQYFGDKMLKQGSNCQNGLGSAVHITATFGFMAAAWVVNQMNKKNVY